jgi:hypothetical protein
MTGRLAGVTRNASRTGLMLQVDATSVSSLLPAVGEMVGVELEVPPNQGFGRKCLSCQATVVRVFTSIGKPPEIALKVHSMDFQQLDGQKRRTARRSAGERLVRVK